MKKVFRMADRVERKDALQRRNLQLAAGIAIFLCVSTVTVSRVEAFRLPIARFFCGFYIKYESEKDHTWYRYCYWAQKENLDGDVENGILQETEIHGYPAIVLQKENEIRVSVNRELQRFYLNGHISYEEAIKILSSVDF